MSKLSDLAERSDLQLGPMLVSPSRRLVEGPAGRTSLEPLIMQAFLLLLDARGKVVTRDELFDRVWGGVIVGDDSLNRAIAKVRRVGAEVAPGLFEIETIPRTGYRLTGEILEDLAGAIDRPSERAAKSSLSRRGVIGGAAAVAAVVGAGGLWWAIRPRTDPRFAALMARGDEAIRSGFAYTDINVADPNSDIVALYEQAVRLEPGNAKAWGLLAYFKSLKAEEVAAKEAAPMIDQADRAARRALAIDPKEPNALTALFLLHGPMLDWATRDRRLRDIIAIDHANMPAMRELMALLQAAGLTRESWIWNERILELAPLSKPNLIVRAMKLWILGKVTESDKVMDRVRGLWPLDQRAFAVRLMLFTLTGRPRAALAMIDDAPAEFDPATNFRIWQIAAVALDTRSPQAIEAARNVCMETARERPRSANSAVMILCALGRTDDAFEVTNGYLLWRGNVVGTGKADARAANDYSRRMTQWLFTPPAAVMRADPRFLKLCEEFGLVAYWRARGIKPDYLVYG